MDVVELRSSSNDLSSAPNSDAEGLYPERLASSLPDSNTIRVAITAANAIDPYSASASVSRPVDPSTNSALSQRQEQPPAKVRKPRKKKVDAAGPAPEKEKKPRKPRATPGTASTSRKKAKTENAGNTPLVQSLLTSGNLATSQLNQPTPLVLAATATPPIEAAKISQNGLSNGHHAMPNPNLSHTSQTSTPQPSPHVQQSALVQPVQSRPKPIFDPIRGVVVERAAPTPPLTSTIINSSPRMPYSTGTSTAISNIINPPQPLANEPQQVDTGRTTPHVTLTSVLNGQDIKDESAMEVDQPLPMEKKPESVPNKPASKPRAKEQPPPLPAGSGLLSSTLFGGDTGTDAKSSGEKGPNIVLHIDLKDPNNKVINFARMAENKYGFAALYPRQAAQKERLARVAAAGAALERAGTGPKGGTSASDSVDEDLSVDIDRESDNDGDAVMSGVNSKGDVGNSGTDGPAPRKRRKRKDEYDADDPFVDDSEMLWEAQAAASKDGFFVYIGPLVPEGEKPAVERADGTIKRGRGRGRGGGPGSRGGRGGAGASAASHGEGGNSRGGGPGSRGGGVTRKPRITKAERQQREIDKKLKDSMAVLAAKPAPGPAS